MKTIDISQIELKKMEYFRKFGSFIQHTNLKTGQLYQLDHFPGKFDYSKDLWSLKNHKPLKIKKNQFFFRNKKIEIENSFKKKSKLLFMA